MCVTFKNSLTYIGAFQPIMWEMISFIDWAIALLIVPTIVIVLGLPGLSLSTVAVLCISIVDLTSLANWHHAASMYMYSFWADNDSRFLRLDTLRQARRRL